MGGECSNLGKHQAHGGRAASGDGADRRRWVGISPAAVASHPTLITLPPGSRSVQPHRSLATGANSQEAFLLGSRIMTGSRVVQPQFLGLSYCPAYSRSAGSACAGGPDCVQGGRGAGGAAAKCLDSVDTAVLAPRPSRRRGSGRLLSFAAAKARSCSGSARGGARGAAR